MHVAENQKVTSNPTFFYKDEATPDTSLDRGGDGQSSDEAGDHSEKVEWDTYTSGKTLKSCPAYACYFALPVRPIRVPVYIRLILLGADSKWC